MNRSKILFLFVCLLFTSPKLMAATAKGILPPDSTTSLVDRSSALLMIEDAKKMYLEGRVRDALIKFRQAAIKDPNSWRAQLWIAKSHYHLDNYGYALQYGEKALSIDSSSIDKEVYDIVGSAYHRMGDLDKALQYYELALAKMSKSAAKENKINEKIASCKFAAEESGKAMFAEKVRLQDGVNSGYNDYSPVLTKQGKELYFTSRRNTTTGGGLNPEEDQYFEDIYRAVWNTSTKEWDSISNTSDILGRLNATGFESISYISPDGNTAYMTINNEAVDEKITTGSSDIFETQLTNKNKWANPKKINNKSINTSYFDGAPTLTADGNTMYFASARNYEKRMTDIYMVTKTGKTWGTAVVLSDSVNTAGNETTPYITPDGRFLFFSSDTHLGMGGYDIFVSENLGNGKWSKAKNLGSTINSVNNDTHFQYYPELKKAMFSTFVLVGQKASMDIFEIDMKDFKLPLK